MKISLQRRHALTVADGACNFLGDSKSQKASKQHYWFKSYGDFAEWVDFAHWWSFIGAAGLFMVNHLVCYQSADKTN